MCLTEGCENKPISRGLCRNCYHKFAKRVRRGITTWGDLIASGQCKRAKVYRGLTPAIRRDNMKRSKLLSQITDEIIEATKYNLDDDYETRMKKYNELKKYM